MSLLCCCASRRRGVSNGDGDSPSPATRLDNPQTSINMVNLPRDCPVMAPVLPSDDPLELGQLIVDDSDGEGEADTSLAKTNSTLEVVKTKLIRHIANETDMGRRGPRAAGHSEEELARRAELRRFRHQRIQDELKGEPKNEGSNEEASNTSHGSTKYLSALINIGQPRGGPRDNFVFGYESGQSLSTTRLSQASSLASKEVIQEEPSDLSCQMGSIPDGAVPVRDSALIEPAMEGSDPDHPSPSKEGDPPADLRSDEQPPIIHASPSQKSLGCSYASPRLDRVLGANSEFDLFKGSQTWEDQAALGIWLISQSLRTRSNSTGLSAENRKAESALIEAASDPAADTGGIDGIEDTPQSLRQKGRIPPCNSVEPAAAAAADESTAPWQGNLMDFRGSEARSSYFTAEDDTASSDVHNGSHDRFVRAPAAIPLGLTFPSYSETESFRQRETELGTIEKRFGEVLSRKRHTPAVRSRFKEEFHDGCSGPRRPSLKVRLNLSISKRSRSRPASLGTALGRGRPSPASNKNASKKTGQRSISHQLGRITSPLKDKAFWISSKENDQTLSPASTSTYPSPALVNSLLAPQQDELSAMEPRSAKPSGTWARFPSHSRSERTRHVSAQEGYRVRERDIRDFMSGGKAQSANGIKDLAGLPSATDFASRSLPVKFARSVKSSLSRLILSKNVGTTSLSLVEPPRDQIVCPAMEYDGSSSVKATLDGIQFGVSVEDGLEEPPSTSTPKSVAASDRNRRATGETMPDIFFTPISRMEPRGGADASMFFYSSELDLSQRGLRRWKSHLDMERASSSCSRPFLAQSLSMNDLRSSSDDESDDIMA